MQEADRILEIIWYKSDTWSPQRGRVLPRVTQIKQRFKLMLTALCFAFWQFYRQCQAQRHHYNGRGWWLAPLWDETVSGKGLGPQEASNSLFSGSTLFLNNIFSFYWIKYLLPPLKKNLGLVPHQNTLISSWINEFFRLSIFKNNSLSLFKVLAVAPFVQRASYKCQLLMTLQFP